jgi:hypothetical protein
MMNGPQIKHCSAATASVILSQRGRDEGALGQSVVAVFTGLRPVRVAGRS